MKGLAMTLTGGMDPIGYPINSIDTHVVDCFSALVSGHVNVAALSECLPSPSTEANKPSEPTLDIKVLAQNGDAIRYIDAMKNAFAGHTMFTAESGRIGMGPRDSMKEGDLICVFLGAGVPFLIRPIGNRGLYMLIGECYVYDIMHGEIFDQLCDPASRGELKEEWIKLV